MILPYAGAGRRSGAATGGVYQMKGPTSGINKRAHEPEIDLAHACRPALASWPCHGRGAVAPSHRYTGSGQAPVGEQQGL